MRVLAIVQGEFGHRKVRNIRAHAPRGWKIEAWELPPSLPPLLDDLEEYLQGNLPKAELVLALGESPSSMQLVPEVARKARAKAVIVPIDDKEWLPSGLELQLKREFKALGIASAFPTPFCALKGSKDERINTFSRYFGRPELELKVEEGVIKGVKVLCDAPCGNTRYAAKRLLGAGIGRASLLAQQYHHQYPCLASSIKDKRAHDNIMNRAGRILENEIKRSLHLTI
ncbi:MAG: DUF166 family protein [Candidatus Hydrothermarchaeota archaeon]|nr:DUF166 family protein [Candidatus Hydrothermarchaeota archaeon]